MNILCVVPCLPNDLNIKTVDSILEQTLECNIEIAVFTEKVVAKNFQAKMSKVLNRGLSSYDLSEFNYLVRVDGDTVLPKNFLEENLKADPDVMGYGMAQIIKVQPFLELMDGKFHPEQDDSYIRCYFLFKGLKSVDYIVEPVVYRKSGEGHSILYYVERGRTRYLCGVFPLKIFYGLRFGFHRFIDFYGYFYAAIKREKRFCFADYIWNLHLTKIRNLFH